MSLVYYTWPKWKVLMWDKNQMLCSAQHRICFMMIFMHPRQASQTQDYNILLWLKHSAIYCMFAWSSVSKSTSLQQHSSRQEFCRTELLPWLRGRQGSICRPTYLSLQIHRRMRAREPFLMEICGVGNGRTNNKSMYRVVNLVAENSLLISNYKFCRSINLLY